MGTCPLSASAIPMTAHSATSGCDEQHFFHFAGGQPMAGDVDHIVGSRHHEDVAVFVDVARRRRSCSSRGSPSGTTTRIASSAFQNVVREPGGSGSLNTSVPISPAFARVPCSSST